MWWLRKGLRLSDSPALAAALEGATALHPLYVLDGEDVALSRCGSVRLRFLLESLADLDAQLRARNSRLFVLHGAWARGCCGGRGRGGAERAVPALSFARNRQARGRAAGRAARVEREAPLLRVVCPLRPRGGCAARMLPPWH